MFGVENNFDDDEFDLTINKSFANDFEAREKRKELRRLENMRREGLLDDENDESSTSESEDEDGEALDDLKDLEVSRFFNPSKNFCQIFILNW